MNPAEFANIAAAEQNLWWYRGMETILFRLLDRHIRGAAPRRVLEAGCGTGYLAKRLAGRYAWPVFPIDLGMEGLRYARRLGVPHPAQADLAALPFQDAAFDLVLSMDVLVHFPRGDERRALAELNRVLSPGGLLVLRVSALDVLHSRHSAFAHERQRFTRSRLIAATTAHGLDLVSCTYSNAFLLPVALTKFRVWEPLLRKPPSSGVTSVHPALNLILRLPLELEAAWIGAGGRFPAGQSLLYIGRKTP